MRTKNAKRLWPVPVTLGVMALAALLAFGLMATYGVSPALADNLADEATTSADHCLKGIDAAHAQSDHAITCATLADTFDVKFLGLASNMKTGKYVYSTGIGNRPEGSVLKEDVDVNILAINDRLADGTEDVVTPATEEVVDLAEIGLEIDDQGTLQRVQSKTVTAHRDDMDNKGQVRLFVFAAAGGEASRIAPVSTIVDQMNKVADLTANHYMVTVQFLGAPVLEVPDAGNVNKDNDTAVPDGPSIVVEEGVIRVGDGVIDEDAGDDPDPRSQLLAYSLLGGDRGTVSPPKKHELTSGDDDGIVLVASLVDANDRRLNDGDKDIDSYVTFTVTYADGSDLNPRVSLETTAVIPVGDNNVNDGTTNDSNHEAELKLTDWRDGDKPVRATVTAVYTGPTGTLTFPDFTIYRSGDTTKANFATYTCELLGNSTPKEGDGCADTMKPVADMLVGRTQQFVVVGKFEDALGNTADGSPTALVTLSDTSAFTEVGTVADKEAKRYMVSDKAAYQDYTITLSHGSGDDKVQQVLTVTVSGPPAAFQLVEPMAYIPLGTTASAEFTVKAVDENGNIAYIIIDADDIDKNDTVDVVVRGVGQNDIRGLSDGKVKLDQHTGEGTFRIFTPLTASNGDQALIIIGSGDTEITHPITFGEPPMAPGMPMNVMAEATSDTEITVSWESPADDGGSAVTGYVLQSKTGTMDFMTIAASSAEVWWNTLDCPMMNAEIPDDATPAPPMDDTDMTSPYCAMYARLSAEATTVVDDVFADEYGTISGTSHSDMDLMAETTYYYRVAAINSVGKGEYSDGMAMAITMTMMMPSMELGAPSITNVMSDAEGMATVMLMPGDNATKHWVWAAPTDRSEGMWHSDSALAGDATMVTFSGLTSGMNHWFIAIAGRGEGDDEEWSAWSGWTVPAIDIQ